MFGFTLAAIQVFPSLILAFLAGQIGVVIGGILALILSYKYVGKVLIISNLKNVAIVVFLPMISTVIAAAAYLTIFGAMG